jgi:hypothetical protein
MAGGYFCLTKYKSMTNYDDDICLVDIENLNTALEYAEDFYVLPMHYSKYNPLNSTDECSCGDPNCKQIGRHPLYKAKATQDQKQIKEWWLEKPDANVGIKAGRESYYALEVRKDIELETHDTYSEPIDNGTRYYFESDKRHNSFTAEGISFIGDDGYLIAGDWIKNKSDIKKLPDDLMNQLTIIPKPIPMKIVTKPPVQLIKNDLVVEIVEPEKSNVQSVPPPQPFWFYNNEKPWIDEVALMEFLKCHGVIRIGDVNPIYARVNHGLIEDISDTQMKDLVMNHLKEIDEQKVFALVHKKSESYFRKSKLTTIESKEVDYINDTKAKVNLFYQNGILVISKDKAKLIPYGDGVIHKKSKLNRDFKTNNETGMFEQMVRNSSSYKVPEGLSSKPDKYGFYLRQSDLESKMLSLGYLINRHQVDSKAKCVIAIDAFIEKDEINGSTCKSLFFKGLRHIRSVKSFNGKSFKLDTDDFVLEGLERHHQVLLIDDANKKLDFELLFNMITDDITINGKWNKKQTITFKDAPKFCITTNYPLDKVGTSISRRQHIIEFSNFYDNERNPVSTHGAEFFDEWNKEEWNKFDTFIVKCVQKYLEAGHLKEAKISNYAINKLGDDMGIFLNWAEALPLNQKLNRKELYTEICIEYSNCGKKIGKKKFHDALKSHATLNGWQYNKHKNGNDDKDRDNNQWVTLTN